MNNIKTFDEFLNESYGAINEGVSSLFTEYLNKLISANAKTRKNSKKEVEELGNSAENSILPGPLWSSREKEYEEYSSMSWEEQGVLQAWAAMAVWAIYGNWDAIEDSWFKRNGIQKDGKKIGLKSFADYKFNGAIGEHMEFLMDNAKAAVGSYHVEWNNRGKIVIAQYQANGSWKAIIKGLANKVDDVVASVNKLPKNAEFLEDRNNVYTCGPWEFNREGRG